MNGFNSAVSSPDQDAGPIPRAPKAPSMGRNSLLYLAGALMQGLGVFLVQPFALRLLNSDTKWQELFLSVSIIQVGVVLAAAGLPLAITKAWFDPEGPGKARAISGFMTFGGLALGILAAAIYWLASRGNGGSLSFVIALLAMGLQSSVLAAQAILRAQGRAVKFVFLSLISSMAAYIGGLAAMLLFGAEPGTFMMGYGFLVLVSARCGWDGKAGLAAGPQRRGQGGHSHWRPGAAAYGRVDAADARRRLPSGGYGRGRRLR